MNLIRFQCRMASRWEARVMRASLVSLATGSPIRWSWFMRAQGYDGPVGNRGFAINPYPACSWPWCVSTCLPFFAYGRVLGTWTGLANATYRLQDVYEAIGARSQGLIGDDELKAIEKAACPGIGTCAGMFFRQHHGLGQRGSRLNRTWHGRHHRPRLPIALRAVHRSADALLEAVRTGIRTVRCFDAEIIRKTRPPWRQRWEDPRNACLQPARARRPKQASISTLCRYRSDQPAHSATRRHETCWAFS